MKKLVLLAMCAVMALSVLTGCGGPGSDKIDKTKTQLYISNYDGGYGTDWLYDIAKKFETKYANTNFEPGTDKKGAQIIIHASKEGSSNVLGSTNNIYFDEVVPFIDMASQNELFDISDIVGDSLSEISGGKELGTIAQKLSPEQQEALKAIGGKYYALPHFFSMGGIAYDAALFAKPGKELYFKADPETGEWNGIAGEGGWTSVESEKAIGPSGIRGGYDAGLPASYEQFERLILRMWQCGVTPFIWSGANAVQYTRFLAQAVWAAYSGKDALMLDFNFGTGTGTGKTVDVVTDWTTKTVSGLVGSSTRDVPIITPTAVEPSTGYLPSQSAGRYYGLQMVRAAVSNPQYFSDKIVGTLSHMDAQMNYIYSDLRNESIAMLIEGNWWYNEAKEAFRMSEATYGNAAKNRDFRWMPMPWKPEGTVAEGEAVVNGKKLTLLDKNCSFAFINGNLSGSGNTSTGLKKSDVAALAKKFLQYCYTDEAMADFQITTGTPKGLNYADPAVIEARTGEMNSFYRSVYELCKVADKVYPYSASPIFVNNQSGFLVETNNAFFSSPGTGVASPYTAFRRNDPMSAKAYFEGMAISSTTWESRYQQWFPPAA